MFRFYRVFNILFDYRLLMLCVCVGVYGCVFACVCVCEVLEHEILLSFYKQIFTYIHTYIK